MTLRVASAQDLPFIVHLEQKFLGLNLVGADELATHQSRLRDPDCQYWIAEDQGAAAGHVILRGIQSPSRSVELMRIVVAEPGRGLGRRVLEAVIAKVFHELSAHRLWLDVYEHNARARHVYCSVGFIEEGLLRECVRMDDRYASLVVMSILEDDLAANERE